MDYLVMHYSVSLNILKRRILWSLQTPIFGGAFKILLGLLVGFCWLSEIKVFMFVCFAAFWNNTLLLVCRTSDRSDQTETGKASESPSWLFWWCCPSLGCPSSCCPKVKTSTVNFLSYLWINAAQWGSIMALPTVTCDWLLPCCDSYLTDGGDRHSGSKLTLDDLFHRDFQIHDPDAKWISGEYGTNASPACFCYFCCTHFTKIR